MRITRFEEGQGLPGNVVFLGFVQNTSMCLPRTQVVRDPYMRIHPKPEGVFEAVFTHKRSTRLVTKAWIHVDIVWRFSILNPGGTGTSRIDHKSR